MQHTWLKPAVFLSIFLLFLCYIFKNSSTVKKLCGPVQKSQCEKSCKIEGAAKKCCGLLAEPSTEWLDSSWIAYSRVTPELSTGWLYSSWMVFVGDLNCLQSDLYLAEWSTGWLDSAWTSMEWFDNSWAVCSNFSIKYF